MAEKPHEGGAGAMRQAQRLAEQDIDHSAANLNVLTMSCDDCSARQTALFQLAAQPLQLTGMCNCKGIDSTCISTCYTGPDCVMTEILWGPAKYLQKRARATAIIAVCSYCPTDRHATTMHNCRIKHNTASWPDMPGYEHAVQCTEM